MPTEVEARICKNNDPNIRCMLKLYYTGSYLPDNGIQACSTTNEHLIASGTDEKKPVIHVWIKKVNIVLVEKNGVILITLFQAKGYRDQQRTYGCNFMTVLAFLNILFMMLIAILWMVGNGNHNWLSSHDDIGKPMIVTPIRSRSAHEVLENADGFLKRNGIDWRDPNWRSSVVVRGTPRDS